MIFGCSCRVRVHCFQNLCFPSQPPGIKWAAPNLCIGSKRYELPKPWSVLFNSSLNSCCLFWERIILRRKTHFCLKLYLLFSGESRLIITNIDRCRQHMSRSPIEHKIILLSLYNIVIFRQNLPFFKTAKAFLILNAACSEWNQWIVDELLYNSYWTHFDIWMQLPSTSPLFPKLLFSFGALWGFSMGGNEKKWKKIKVILTCVDYDVVTKNAEKKRYMGGF